MPNPTRSPIRGAVVDYSSINDGRILSIADREANVAFYGNGHATRSQHPILVAEEAAHLDGCRIIAVTSSHRWNRIGEKIDGDENDDKRLGGRDTLVFGRFYGLTLNSKNAKLIADIVVSTQCHVVLNVGHLLASPDLHIVLQSVFGRIVETDDMKNAVLAVDVMQALLARRRHSGQDGDAIVSLQRIMETSFDRNISLLMTASSPAEIPIEFRSGTRTRVLCKSTTIEQVRQMEVITGFNLQANWDQPWGMGGMDHEDHWTVPGSGPHPDRMLHSPMRPFITKAGIGDPSDPPLSAAQAEANEKLRKAAKKKPKQTRKGATKAVSDEMTECVAHMSHHAVRDAGIPYYSAATTIARMVIGLERDGCLPNMKQRIGTDDVIECIRANPSIGIAAAWKTVAGASEKCTALAAPTLMATAYTIARSEDPQAADAYFGNLSKGDIASDLIEAMLKFDASGEHRRSQRRLDGILTSFRRTIPANEDSPIRTAA